ncbi:MAG: hypothetical protein Q9N68_08875 [Gammaproteobacteria bacterium]|nr:hypothetical protein [Gammaproteobacteria bacterium]
MEICPVTQHVEQFCKQGCQQVYRIIASLEQGEELREVRTLAPKERRLLLTELKSIMQVYQL